MLTKPHHHQKPPAQTRMHISRRRDVSRGFPHARGLELLPKKSTMWLFDPTLLPKFNHNHPKSSRQRRRRRMADCVTTWCIVFMFSLLSPPLSTKLLTWRDWRFCRWHVVPKTQNGSTTKGFNELITWWGLQKAFWAKWLSRGWNVYIFITKWKKKKKHCKVEKLTAIDQIVISKLL